MSRKYKHIMSPLKVGNVILKSRLLSANALPHFLQGPELYPSDAVVDYLVGLAKPLATGRTSSSGRASATDVISPCGTPATPPWKTP